MFIQTGDRRNWQARYIVQNPYGGSVSECAERVGKMECATMCNDRVSEVRAALGSQETNQEPETPQDKSPTVTVEGSRIGWIGWRALAAYRGKSPRALQGECVAACSASKAQGLEAASRYYEKDLPERITVEKQTLAQLTGWSLHDIDAMPGARRFSRDSPVKSATPRSTVARLSQPSWHKLFSD